MRRFVVGMLGCALMTGCNPGAAGGVDVTKVSVRVAPPTATTAAVYASLHNRGDVADTLLGIESDVDGNLRLHAYTVDAGLAVMRAVDNVEIAAGATVRLAPGALHGMLSASGAAITPGHLVRLTFRFAHAPAVAIGVPVSTIVGEE